jgi:endonuclease/exonuclease/phosphatase family metal-dependent hydrolase
MGKILRRILLLVYLITLIPMLGGLLSQWINPAIAWPLAFFGLFFPLIVLIQIAFLVTFMLLRSKAVVLPILFILANWNPIAHTFQISMHARKSTASANQVKVMSYNVRLFDYFQWSGQKKAAEGIFDYIKISNPDILCLQEFMIQDPGKLPLDRVKSELSWLPYSYIEYNYTMQARRHGLAIFSRYPILNAGHEHFPETRNMVIYTDLKIGKDTIRVYNNHLESIHFDRDEIELIDDKTDEMRITRDKVGDIVRRLKGAYIRRASQAIVINKHIKQSPYRVLVCGDFNDTPVSFTTRKIRDGLFDSFRSGGNGMGITFPNMKAPLRIDYILHSKEMESSGYEIGHVKFSDHRPVSTFVKLD